MASVVTASVSVVVASVSVSVTVVATVVVVVKVTFVSVSLPKAYTAAALTAAAFIPTARKEKSAPFAEEESEGRAAARNCCSRSAV